MEEVERLCEGFSLVELGMLGACWVGAQRLLGLRVCFSSSVSECNILI